MRTIYLIDFENTHDDGFTGWLQLESNDVLHIFYTDNASRISLDVMNVISKAHVYYHHCPKGSQSLDMCLVSYLGMLLMGEQSNDDEFVIISKDKGYDNVIAFWKDISETNVISRRHYLGAHTCDVEPESEEIDTPVLVKRFGSQSRLDLNNNIQAKLSHEGYKSSVIGQATSIVLKCISEPNHKQLVWRRFVSAFGQKKGSDVYYAVRELL